MPIYVDNLQSLKTEMETNIVQVCNWDNCKELPAWLSDQGEEQDQPLPDPDFEALTLVP